jgi:peptidyl-prolyl cis-trans isomerase B (cyclophilin B)
MTPTKDRQRAAARARLEREMAERAAQAQQRRKKGTVIGGAVAGAVALILIIVIIVVATSGDDKKPNAAASPTASAAADGAATCNWLPNPDPSASPAPPANPALVKTGTPPERVPGSGDSTMTITTNAGTITAALDVANAPCASASLAFLAGKNFYNNTACHRLVTAPFSILQCGNPSTTGDGGPSYLYGTENLPTGKRPTYIAGDIAIANSSAENTNGSQFFIVLKDAADGAADGSGTATSVLAASYTVVGHITAGLDVAQKIGDGGVAAGSAPSADGSVEGKPKLPLTITTLTVTAPPAPSPLPSASSGSATPAPTAS